jgi:hypothetical protein
VRNPLAAKPLRQQGRPETRAGSAVSEFVPLHALDGPPAIMKPVALAHVLAAIRLISHARLARIQNVMIFGDLSSPAKKWRRSSVLISTVGNSTSLSDFVAKESPPAGLNRQLGYNEDIGVQSRKRPRRVSCGLRTPAKVIESV